LRYLAETRGPPALRQSSAFRELSYQVFGFPLDLAGLCGTLISSEKPRGLLDGDGKHGLGDELLRLQRVHGYALSVFLISVSVRVTWAVLAHVTPISDFRTYDAIAAGWVQTGHYGTSAYRTPGYPGFLAVVYAVFGHDPKAAVTVQAFLGAVSSGLLVLLASHVVSSRASFIAGLLHALSPTAVVYVTMLASENLAVPLLLAGLLCLAAAADRSHGSAWLTACSAALFGVLLLVRPAGLYFLPAWVLLCAYSFKRSQRRPRQALVFLAVTALVLAPWLTRNYLLGLGPLTLSTAGGVNAWMGNNEAAVTGGGFPASRSPLAYSKLGEKERNSAHLALAVAWARQHPSRYLSLCLRRAVCLLGPRADPWAAKYLVPTPENDLAMAAARRQYQGDQSVSPALVSRALAVQRGNGVWLTAWRALTFPLVLLALVLAAFRWRTYAIVLLPALSYLTGLSLVFAKPRFRELADPLLFVLLAGLLSDLLFGTTELGSRLSRALKAAIAALLVVASIAVHVFRYAT